MKKKRFFSPPNNENAIHQPPKSAGLILSHTSSSSLELINEVIQDMIQKEENENNNNTNNGKNKNEINNIITTVKEDVPASLVDLNNNHTNKNQKTFIEHTQNIHTSEISQPLTSLTTNDEIHQLNQSTSNGSGNTKQSSFSLFSNLSEAAAAEFELLNFSTPQPLRNSNDTKGDLQRQFSSDKNEQNSHTSNISEPISRKLLSNGTIKTSVGLFNEEGEEEDINENNNKKDQKKIKEKKIIEIAENENSSEVVSTSVKKLKPPKLKHIKNNLFMTMAFDQEGQLENSNSNSSINNKSLSIMLQTDRQMMTPSLSVSSFESGACA